MGCSNGASMMCSPLGFLGFYAILASTFFSAYCMANDREYNVVCGVTFGIGLFFWLLIIGCILWNIKSICNYKSSNHDNNHDFSKCDMICFHSFLVILAMSLHAVAAFALYTWLMYNEPYAAVGFFVIVPLITILDIMALIQGIQQCCTYCNLPEKSIKKPNEKTALI